ncbi:MAG: Sec-independent protein translocase protein TatB [bacterium]|nr:Sec-independent protein translocase protein TatB [bacterium]
MFGIGMQELLIILAVALIILGPKKLPEMARALGRAFAELQRATQDLRDSVEFDIEPEEEEPEHEEDEPVADELPPPPGSHDDEVVEQTEPDQAEEPSTERTA